ncbi:MAG: sulfotransferase domain-containing protein [Actinomycetota bacterium]
MSNLTPTFRRLRFRDQTVRRAAVWWRYRRADLNPEDAFLVSYPRSGTTWLRFLLFEALTNKSPIFGSIKEAVPSLTKHHNAAPILGQRGRLIQSHERFSDGDRRVIYAVRDARSVALSEYQWQRRLGLEPGTLDRFINDFVRGKSNPWGAWDRHVRFWFDSEPARCGHLHVIKFEDLKRDTVGTLRLALSFLGVEMAGEELRSVVDNNSVERMRAKEDEARERGWRSTARSDIRFVNEGRSERWRDELTAAQKDAIEARFLSTLEELGYLSS